MGKLKKIFIHVPIWVRVIVCIFFACVLLHFSFIIYGPFAELYRGTGGAFFRGVLAHLTNPFPMSMAESLVIALPFILAYICVKALQTNGDLCLEVRLISGIAAVALLAYSLFVLTFAAGFYSKPVGEYFGLEQRDITLDELYEATLITIEGANEAYAEIEGKSPNGATTMGMSYDEMNDTLLSSFESLYADYAFPSQLNSRVKPVVLSEPMTYTHISGVYAYFSGEANINVNYPDFVIPYTAAHELSHQRGVSRENEANFVAFLVCIDSEDPYIRYSGYLNMYQYMASALASSSYEKYVESTQSLCDGIKHELNAYSRFFDKYRENTVAKISDAVNDSYLTIMSGTDSRSYGMVIDLATVYLIGD